MRRFFSSKFGTALVDFYSKQCAPCRAMKPHLQEIKKEINVIEIDAEQEQELSMKYGIISLPTFILFKNDVEVDRIVGYQTLEKLKLFINKGCQ